MIAKQDSLTILEQNGAQALLAVDRTVGRELSAGLHNAASIRNMNITIIVVIVERTSLARLPDRL